MYVGLPASKLSRGAGVGKGEGEDLIGQILTAQHQRSHKGGSGSGIQIFETAVQALLPLFLPQPHTHGRTCLQTTRRSKNALKGQV